MWELRDRLVEASTIMPGSAHLVDELRDVPRQRRIDHLAAALCRRFESRRMPSTGAIDHALALLESRRGNVAIDYVARTVGITRRHLERRFKNEVGLGAKHIARIMRF